MSDVLQCDFSIVGEEITVDGIALSIVTDGDLKDVFPSGGIRSVLDGLEKGWKGSFFTIKGVW